MDKTFANLIFLQNVDKTCKKYEICKCIRRSDGKPQEEAGGQLDGDSFCPSVGKFAPNWIISVGSTCCGGRRVDIVKGIFSISSKFCLTRGAISLIGWWGMHSGRNIVTATRLGRGGCRCWFIHSRGWETLDSPNTKPPRNNQQRLLIQKMTTKTVPGIWGSFPFCSC